jgi:hypothetical protein
MPKAIKKTVSQLAFPGLYLGVDGGGTKTHIVLTDKSGKILSEGFAGASNPLRVGVEVAVGNIFKAIDSASDASDRSRDDIVAATLGLAGVRRADIRRVVTESFQNRLPLKQIQVMTDAEIALYGTTLGKPGSGHYRRNRFDLHRAKRRRKKSDRRRLGTARRRRRRRRGNRQTRFAGNRQSVGRTRRTN